jgi:hypothetical protein
MKASHERIEALVVVSLEMMEACLERLRWIREKKKWGWIHVQKR